MMDYDTIPIVQQPRELKVNLFKHQLASIYAMETLEREQKVDYDGGIRVTKLGINADETGYGKTLSMLGLITRDKMEWDMETPFIKETISQEAGGLIYKHEYTRYKRLPCTLILVSSSILGQWEKELAHTSLKVGIVSTNREAENIEAENYDVILVSLSSYNTLVKIYNGYAWKRFIFDEPGHVRVSGMKEVYAGFYWFVTATPDAISAKHRNCRGSFMKKIIGECWFNFTEYFNSIIIQNDTEFVQASFQMPPTVYKTYTCYQPIASLTSGIVNNNIQTMISAGNIEGAIAALGGKKTRNIFNLIKEKKLAELRLLEEKIKKYTIKRQNALVKISTDSKRRIEEQLEQLESRFETMLTDLCSICMGMKVKPVLEPCCQNIFCGECLLKWLNTNQTCPVCRSCISVKELVYIEKNTEDCETKDDTIIATHESQAEERKTQVDRILEIIKSCKDGKFLIFSAYDETFDVIRQALNANEIEYVQIKGSRHTRERNINSFKTGSVNVVFLNTEFNGSGINLQEATDIILYHEMSETTRNQIIGRANRIGRKQTLYVHQLKVGI
jgi:SNF2 family DNA or RNA helicase